LRDLREFAEVDIHESDPRYREPLARDAQRLAKKLSAECEVVLLGSIATAKYVDVLLENFQHRFAFPSRFCRTRRHESRWAAVTLCGG